MSRWLDQLRTHLDQLQQQHLLRQLHPADRCARLVRRGGKTLLNLASNDYLGLTGHPHLVQAVIDAAKTYGVGAGASRLVTGHLDVHRHLERRFADFKHAPAALLFPTGYMANLAVLTALVGEDDLVCLDKLNHASLIDAAQAGPGLVRVFAHRHVQKLERLLERTSVRGRRIANRVIVADSVFSMDGDCADLPALCELRDRYDAVLVVDEAHATGVLGASGSGLAEHQQVADRIDVTVSTASKALGALGGIVTAPQAVIDTLINRARSFIYTTAAPPTQAAAIDAGLDVVRDEPERRQRLAELARRLRAMLADQGWSLPEAQPPTPIVPLVVGEAEQALALSRRLEEQGLLAPAIRPPAVAAGTARVRLTLRSDLADSDIDRIADAAGGPEASPFL